METSGRIERVNSRALVCLFVCLFVHSRSSQTLWDLKTRTWVLGFWGFWAILCVNWGAAEEAMSISCAHVQETDGGSKGKASSCVLGLRRHSFTNCRWSRPSSHVRWCTRNFTVFQKPFLPGCLEREKFAKICLTTHVSMFFPSHILLVSKLFQVSSCTPLKSNSYNSTYLWCGVKLFFY